MPRRKEEQGFKTQRPTVFEHAADALTNLFGTVTFLVFNLLFFVLWIAINTGLVNGLQIFDPFPFGMLTTIVSLEAIVLSIIVLMSQNRASKRDVAREEADYRIDVKAEKQVEELNRKLTEVLKHVKQK